MPGQTSDTSVNTSNTPDKQLLEKTASIVNSGEKVVILVGQGTLDGGDLVITMSEKSKYL